MRARDRRGCRHAGARPVGLAALLAGVLVATLLVAVGAARLQRVVSPARAAALDDPAPPVVNAWAAAVIDRLTGRIVFQKNSSAHLTPASCTKVMTALLVLEHCRDLDVYARVPAEAMGKPGRRLGLAVGDRITLRNLLRGSLIWSATDCSVTLAHYVSGSEKAFVAMMNDKARTLGLRDTHLVNCSGVLARGHYISARDLARISRLTMRDARFRAIVSRWRVHVRWPPAHDRVVSSRNWLLQDYDWGDGIKTGNNPEGRYCMIASGKYGLRRLIVVTLHEETIADERVDVLGLFEWADALYAVRTLVTAGDLVTSLPLADGSGVLDLMAKQTLTAVARRAAVVRVELQVPTTAPDPVVTGAVVGRADYYADGQLLGHTALLAGALHTAPSSPPSSAPSP